MNARRWGRLAETAVAAILWATVAGGTAVVALTLPAYTSTMSRALDIPRTAGLPVADVARLSDSVRALVADPDYDPLPSSWAGLPAFDESAVSHLLDVRGVIALARTATGIAALLLATWVAYCVLRRRLGRMRAGMRAGAVLTGALIAFGAIAAMADFSWFFTAFHGLFFASGTWTFPSDSLLIRLFPERFWMASGVAWAVLTAAGAAALLVAAGSVRRAEARDLASRTANNV
jgi:integral membrane protein (TIGR01906 family)